MLLSVVSAILFKMKSTGLVDILGPVYDARLGATGSLATYVSKYDTTDFLQGDIIRKGILYIMQSK